MAVAITFAVCPVSSAAGEKEWSFKNTHTINYENEFFRLPLEVPSTAFKVYEDGREIPFVLDESLGRRDIWVGSSIGPGDSREYRIAPGSPKAPRPARAIKKDAHSYVLDNGIFAVRVPAVAEGDAPPCPVLSVKLGPAWIGSGGWKNAPALKSFKADIVDNGALFQKVTLRYEFDALAGAGGNIPAFSEIAIAVMPDCPFAIVEERHAMPKNSAWEFVATDGWDASGSVIEQHYGGMGTTKRDESKKGTLLPGQVKHQPPELLLNLFPRWNQHCKDGWYAAATDGKMTVGALSALAGYWIWPHDNSIRCLVKESGDSLTLRMPTRHGRRYWMLVAGEAETLGTPRELAVRRAYESLDTIVNSAPILDWPGIEGEFTGYWPLTGQINPTAGVRGWGKRLMRNAGQTVDKYNQLTQAQVMISPHVYGSYWLFWSPENPNFFTDFMKVPIGMILQLRNHPRYEELADMAVNVFREDIYHSIALPSGSGNECPGYQQYAMGHHMDMAKVIKQYTDEDPMQWPRLKAGARFLVHLSQPMADGRRGSHPGGDTHWEYIQHDPAEFAKEFGVEEDVTKFETEELANFGVVFRNRCGTERETYLAFKSGPARGHFHGDQLSFHYSAGRKQLAIDHACSYNPHAAQEHMHNRVAFFTEDMPYANLDGFERVIAFKPGAVADIAIGQVENTRLREVAKFPPNPWDMEYPRLEMDGLMKYRRTVVQVKGDKRDYFVIRDQYESPADINAVYCLHVLGDTMQREGSTFSFDGLDVFVAEPEEYEASSMDWTYTNTHGKTSHIESTKGLRLTLPADSGEFVTVLMPTSGGPIPKMAPIADGVRVGTDEIAFGGNAIDDDDSLAYVTVRRDAKVVSELTGADIDMDRDQGEIGLFVPDAGYPMGDIPDWLIRQRSKLPEWAPDWAKTIRKATE